MRLTNYSDYSIRVLIYLATNQNHKLVNIKEIAEVYGISKNHLMKIIYNLGKLGYIETIRGRNGGIRLAKSPAEINIGEIIRKTEEDFYLVECFQNHSENCTIAPVCSLKYVFNKALESFLQVLDGYSLEDVTENSPMLRDYFEMYGANRPGRTDLST
ncbi:Rrf2 family transcriptional regulator [Bacillus sp. MUM 13]|uniref:Rrf2 family transcriptional regulator n=1 Tax=Bacillus sp. MUM 13 TaxID=1678001 RepID=UPI0008F55959|nr:Rrf2 family transcriptional regulator [Bacillus sp. MUM 13]OIK07434.1 Rrf2 family transcriptional regulator [Bacillus sp. MUM 13]